MNKHVLLAIGILSGVTLFVAGCTSSAATTNPATTIPITTTTTAATTTTPTSTNINEVQASLGQEFTLPVNKTAIISGESLSFKFESVLTDSRCPKGAQCVWAGEAKCQMQVVQSGQTPATLVLTETGGTSGYSQSTYQAYKIEFQLQPYPEVSSTPENNKTIGPADYKLLMKITK